MKILLVTRKRESCESDNRKIVRIMKKKSYILLLTALMFFLCACGNSYKINVVGGADLLISCPKSAAAGETVTVETKTVSDGWVEVTASGTEVKAVQGDVFQFVMPKQNVDVRILFVGEEVS